MSKRVSIIPASAVFDDRVSPSALRVLSVLGSYTDANGRCIQSLSSIAKDLKCTKQAIAKQIKALSDAGYLEVTTRRRNDGGTAENLYVILG